MIGPNVPQKCWVTDVLTPQCLNCNWSVLVNKYTAHIPNSQPLLEFQHDPAAECPMHTCTRITGLVLSLSLFPALLLVLPTKFTIITIILIWDHLLGSSMQAVPKSLGSSVCFPGHTTWEEAKEDVREKYSLSLPHDKHSMPCLASLRACYVGLSVWKQTLYNCLLILRHFYNAHQPCSFSEVFSLYIWPDGFHAHRFSQTQIKKLQQNFLLELTRQIWLSCHFSLNHMSQQLFINHVCFIRNCM